MLAAHWGGVGASPWQDRVAGLQAVPSAHSVAALGVLLVPVPLLLLVLLVLLVLPPPCIGCPARAASQLPAAQAGAGPMESSAAVPR